MRSLKNLNGIDLDIFKLDILNITDQNGYDLNF